MAEVQRSNRMSSCGKSYRVDKVRRERLLSLRSARVSYTRKSFNVLIFATKIPCGIEMSAYLSVFGREHSYAERWPV
jgi:hypothetical protein